MKKIYYRDKDNNLISYSSFLCKEGFRLYKIIRVKSRKKISLDYNPIEKVLIVKCPINYPKKTLDRIVKYMYEKKISVYADLKQQKPWVLMGKELPVEVVYGEEFKYCYYGDKIVVYIHNEAEYPLIAKKFLIDFATIMFTIRLAELIKEVHESGYLLKCSWNKSYYGMCYYWSRGIDMNAFLVQFPSYISDRVLYHEIAHFKVHDHYKEFWDLLHTYCPKAGEKVDVERIELYTQYLHKYTLWYPDKKLLSGYALYFALYY